MIAQQDRPPRPFFTLRGHAVGVTALTVCETAEPPLLISGDEIGSLIVWDLSIFRKLVEFEIILKSKVQSLRTISLRIDGSKHRILVGQSRDDGVQLLDLDNILCDQTAAASAQVIATFPTYGSLFSRGDAIESNKDETAILAYPAIGERNLVTVRFLGANAKTFASGTAQRAEDDTRKSCTVFDIIVRESASTGSYNLFVAYEDGCICAYCFSLESKITVPVINSTGLKIDLIGKYDCEFRDFVSAFDVGTAHRSSESCYKVVAGSPSVNLVFWETAIASRDHGKPQFEQVRLCRRGVSTVTIRPDLKLLAAATWDNSVVLYSLKTRKHLVTLRNHTKQVQSILFINKACMPTQFMEPDTRDEGDSSRLNVDRNFSGTKYHQQSGYVMCCSALDGTISITSIY